MEGLGTGLVDQWIAMNPPCLRQHRGFTQGSANDFPVLGVVRGRPVSMKHVIPRSQFVEVLAVLAVLCIATGGRLRCALRGRYLQTERGTTKLTFLQPQCVQRGGLADHQPSLVLTLE